MFVYIPGRWERKNSGDIVLYCGDDKHEIARIFKGCGAHVACVGDYKIGVARNIVSARRMVMAELKKRATSR